MSLQVEHLSFQYHCWKVLDDVSFRAENGNLVCLLGCNGAGKSTLFRCILSLLPYKKGKIFVDEAEVKLLTMRERAHKIAYIPQSQAGVFNYSALDMVLMGTTSQLSRFSNPGKEQIRQAVEALELLEIGNLKFRNYAHLSGGERQLVLIARAVAQKAKTIVMDEPCSSLDYGNQIRVMEQIKKLAKQGYLILMSTHNPEQAFLFADKVLVLQNKKIKCFGDPKQVLNAELIEQVYGIPVSIQEIDEIYVCIPKGVRKGS